MKNFNILILIPIFIVSCKQPATDKSTDLIATQDVFWEDQTALYLPKTAEWTNRVEVADVNGDNKIDLLFANGGNYSEPGEAEASRVFLNQGPESKFKEVTDDIFREKKFHARVIKVRDVNNDKVPDIFVGTTFQTQSQLYIGLGSGKFQNVTASQLPNLPASIGDAELGDVDDDGDLDLVLADWGSGNNMNNSGGRTKLWLNDGTGAYIDVTATQMPDILIQFSWDLEFFDFDNDFDLDIAISCKRCGTSRMFVNDGKGYFEDKRVFPAYTNNYEFEPMDINQDGFLDLVTINDGEIVDQVSYSRREHIFLNDSGNRFLDVTSSNWPDSENVGEDDNNVVFLDYDSDGDADFLISSLTGEDRLLVNDGVGNFTLKQPVLHGSPTPLTLSMVVGDINMDQRLDIIMGQGEGKNGIEERIFLGGIPEDTAPPVISHQLVSKSSANLITIKARVHDNKSPNMPHDWTSVQIISSTDTVDMTWYGENLWKADMKATSSDWQAQICATDYCGNKECLMVQY